MGYTPPPTPDEVPPPGTAGNVLTDNGSAWVSAAPTGSTQRTFGFFSG